MRLYRLLAFLDACGFLLAAPAAAAESLPTWLSVGATQRTRYEYLRHHVRGDGSGSVKALSLRTTLAADIRFASAFLGVELIDSRTYLVQDESLLNATLINPLEPLQIYVGARSRDFLAQGVEAQVQAGRLTLDFGSRRLVARNGFRNTINAFTGVDMQWTSTHRDRVRGFATLPVRIPPDEPEALADHRIELDRERFDSIFWGVFLTSREWARRLRLEAYLFGLHERDAPDTATSNRRLFTPGFRFYRPLAGGQVDWEIEAAVQLGTSRATASSDDIEELHHRALFGHAALGYSLGAPWPLRVVMQYDYASGDADPEDDDNGRFDTLFGARRFEFGPTGIYGALARSNISSPGLRWEVRTGAALDGFVAYRAVWLAQARDAWTTTGLRDPTGRAGSFVGRQIEAGLRFLPGLPGNAALELGLAYLHRGRFAETASDGNRANPIYAYAQLGFEVR